MPSLQPPTLPAPNACVLPSVGRLPACAGQQAHSASRGSPNLGRRAMPCICQAKRAPLAIGFLAQHRRLASAWEPGLGQQAGPAWSACRRLTDRSLSDASAKPEAEWHPHARTQAGASGPHAASGTPLPMSEWIAGRKSEWRAGASCPGQTDGAPTARSRLQPPIPPSPVPATWPGPGRRQPARSKSSGIFSVETGTQVLVETATRSTAAAAPPPSAT